MFASALLVLPFLCLRAEAYTHMQNDTGNVLHWGVREIPFHVNPANDLGLPEHEVVDAVLAALDTWERVGAGIRFVDEGETDVSETAYDGVNTIFFAKEWDFDTRRVAMTSAWSESDGTLQQFDISMNAADWDWTLDGDAGALDLRNVLTHEIGHVLGMGHTEIEDASMYADAARGEILKRTLESDDELGLLDLYPADLDGISCSSTGRSAGVGGWLAGLGLCLALGLGRRQPLRASPPRRSRALTLFR